APVAGQGLGRGVVAQVALAGRADEDTQELGTERHGTSRYAPHLPRMERSGSVADPGSSAPAAAGDAGMRESTLRDFGGSRSRPRGTPPSRDTCAVDARSSGRPRAPAAAAGAP